MYIYTIIRDNELMKIKPSSKCAHFQILSVTFPNTIYYVLLGEEMGSAI